MVFKNIGFKPFFRGVIKNIDGKNAPWQSTVFLIQSNKPHYYSNYTLPLWDWYLNENALPMYFFIEIITPYQYGIDTVFGVNYNILWIFSFNVSPYHYGIDTVCNEIVRIFLLVRNMTPYHNGRKTIKNLVKEKICNRSLVLL